MNKKTAMRLFFGAYAVAILGLLMISLFNFTSDSIMFATGEIATKEYTVDDFSLKDFEKFQDNKIITTSVDPQLIIEEYNKKGTMVSIDMSFNRYPGEVCLYYTRGSEDFSLESRVWAKQRNDGRFEFVLPRGKISRIRIDPSNFTGIELTLNKFVLNPKRSFTSYFAYSGETIFNICVWPGLAAALCAWLYTAYSADNKKTKKPLDKTHKKRQNNKKRRS
ncbi:MAG: hypothetical protein RSA78_03440 [Oscillospiraceae bacterium]